MKREYYIHYLIIIFLLLASGLFCVLHFETLSDEEYRQKMHEKYTIYSLILPDSLSFAGEKVPIQNNDIYERMDYEFLKKHLLAFTNNYCHKTCKKVFSYHRAYTKKKQYTR